MSEISRGQRSFEAFAEDRRRHGCDLSSWEHLDITRRESWEAAAIANREIPAQSLAEDEIGILGYLTSAWNKFIKLPNRSAEDNQDFRRCIDDLNRQIAMRVAQRCNPEIWNQS